MRELMPSMESFRRLQSARSLDSTMFAEDSASEDSGTLYTTCHELTLVIAYYFLILIINIFYSFS